MTSQLLWTLIAIQIVMGAFDTLYHHELTERLAWRPSQKFELRLHAIRNFFYAAIFLTLGWFEVHGWLAWLLMAILAIEIVITLMDFVEEDVSRKLPASERINHTLLALNYGAILVLAAPVLLGWAAQPTAIVAAYYGIWSLLSLLSAVGVAIFGLRDFLAAGRSERLVLQPAGQLLDAIVPPQTVLVTGATGFIGRRLAAALAAQGHRVIALVRDPAKSLALQPPYTLVTQLSQIPPGTKIDAIVNLAGEPIANGLWTVRKRQRILQSRLDMTQEILKLIARLETRPKVLVNGSAIGWYGLRGDEALDESAGSSACFSHSLCDAWEMAARSANTLELRVVLLRIGLVLGSEGGILARLLTPFEFALGGPIGSGRQWMSWIERDDLVRLIGHCIATADIAGPVNATAPEPVRNAELSAALGHVLHRPAIFRAPARLLQLALGDFADELLLGGQRVIPAKAESAGFVFRHRTLSSALDSILGGNPAITQG